MIVTHLSVSVVHMYMCCDVECRCLMAWKYPVILKKVSKYSMTNSKLLTKLHPARISYRVAKETLLKTWCGDPAFKQVEVPVKQKDALYLNVV